MATHSVIPMAISDAHPCVAGAGNSPSYNRTTPDGVHSALPSTFASRSRGRAEAVYRALKTAAFNPSPFHNTSSSASISYRMAVCKAAR